MAMIRLSVNGKEYEANASGDGQYDAFIRALRNIYRSKLKRSFPKLTNYTVNIPPGGRSDALVHTTITWEYEGHVIKTRGLEGDQIESAINATVKMLNIIENL